MASVPWLSAAELVARHAVLLLDAYGVLVDSTGAVPGAAGFVAALERQGKPYFVLTNDAARLPETARAFYQRLGIPVGEGRVIAAGELIAPYLRARAAGRRQRVLVLGPADSRAYVERADVELVDDVTSAEPVDVIVAANTDERPFAQIERAVNAAFAAIEADRPPALLAPNPDLLFPRRPGEFGVTAGALALVIEAAIASRYPQLGLRFERLGKPYRPIFEEAVRRAGTRDLVLVGDQLETDVRGANAFGIASALVGTGVARIDDDASLGSERPSYRLRPFGSDE